MSKGAGRDRWTVMEALRWTGAHLESCGIESARLEAERMLSLATGLSRVELYANHDRALSDKERAAYREAIKRRVAGEPLQYIVGEVAFRHIVLKVAPGVFIPRPETETLVQAVIDGVAARRGDAPGEGLAPLARLEEGTFPETMDSLACSRQRRLPSRPEHHPAGPGDVAVRVLDLCTGSGAVALSIAKEVAGARVVAVDMSPAAVGCARANAERLGLADAVEVREGDLFETLSPGERFDAVVANPPYVPREALERLPREVRDHEPAAALDGGEQGLDVVRRILEGAKRVLDPGGILAMEIDVSHADAAAEAASAAGYLDACVLDDLAGRPRVLVGRTPDEAPDGAPEEAANEAVQRP